jgi:hypothetical protein
LEQAAHERGHSQHRVSPGKSGLRDGAGRWSSADILAVGRTAKRFIPDVAGHLVLRPMMTVTLSVDHRVVDGAEATRFLSTLQAILEISGAQWG